MSYHAADVPTNVDLRNPNPCAQCGVPLIARRGRSI